MKTLVQKLIKIQSELKAPKNQRNNFGGYNYRSCEDILEAVKPLLAQQGVLLNISDELVFVGNRYYIKATATITDGENGISNSALAREQETKKGMDESQITGAASSYARKYALNGLLCIDDTKDADATNTHGKEEKPQPIQDDRYSKENLLKAFDSCVASMNKHGEYAEGEADYEKVSTFADTLFRHGLKEEAMEVRALLDKKTKKDTIPY